MLFIIFILFRLFWILGYGTGDRSYAEVKIQKWKYKVEIYKFDTIGARERLQSALNHEGIVGWELISVEQKLAGFEYEYQCIFKAPDNF